MTTLATTLLGLVGLLILGLVIYMAASRFFSLPCPVWLSWLIEMDNPFTKTNRAAFIVEHLGLQPGMAVLDAGCGPGRLTIPIAKHIGEKGQVVAMDLQAGMILRAQERARAAKLTNVQFLQAGLGEGKLERDKFDRALLVTVLGEIPNQKAALKEIFTALKSGGILSITEIIFDNHFQSRKTVLKLAGEAGFREKMFFGNRIAFIQHFKKGQ